MRYPIRILTAALVIAGAMILAPAARAQQGDLIPLVIGVGFGSHAPMPSHKAELAGAELEVIATAFTQVYAEWYLFDWLGVGARFDQFDASVSASASGTIAGVPFAASTAAELDVRNMLATVTWLPLGSDSYAFLGVVGGFGTSQYEYKVTNDPGDDYSKPTSGTAALAGAYVDWGADGFGARFGGQYLLTMLDDVDGESINISGRQIYLDLRWAF